MGNIYKSLSDLMERNKHIFDFLKKKPAEGLYKAIWESRDSEINELKQNIQTLEVKQEKLTEQTQKIQIIEKDEVSKIRENTRRYHALNHRMEEELKRIDHDLNSLG